MAFGQQSGHPANARRVEELLEHVQQAGYRDFREARHPLGLTQRQAAGRFTQDEVDALLAQLSGTQLEGVPFVVEGTKLTEAAESVLRVLPAERLAMELERRGWIVIAP
jgi:hypothetical protein